MYYLITICVMIDFNNNSSFLNLTYVTECKSFKHNNYFLNSILQQLDVKVK